jgi:hypothetical protein
MTAQRTHTEEEIAEKVADLEATYQLLCEFCVQMEFRGSSLTGAMAIMLLDLASARGLEPAEALKDIGSLWDKVMIAGDLFDRAGSAVH